MYSKMGTLKRTRPQNLRILFTFTVLCAFIHPTLESSSNPSVFEPSTVTDDYGNTADASSTITFANMPSRTGYKTDASYEDGGMDPFYDLAKSFINTVQPNKPPYGKRFESTHKTLFFLTLLYFKSNPPCSFCAHACFWGSDVTIS